MRIVFMGTPAFAVAQLEALARGPDPVVAVVAQPDRPRGRGLQPEKPATKVWAEARAIPVLQPEKVKGGRLAELVRPFAPEVIVVAAYGRILPPDVLALPPRRCVNVHASLLPKYRGAAPIAWALVRGERETGVSIMQMSEGLDEGPVYLRRATTIGPDENAAELHDRLAALGGEALLEALRGIAAGTQAAVPQDSAQATFAPPLTKEDGRLDFSLAAQAVHDRVRGLVPWPGTFTTLGGALLKVHRARLVRAAETFPAGEPGQVLSATADGVVVACGAGAVVLLEVQAEGRRRMTVPEFRAGRAALDPGARLGG